MKSLLLLLALATTTMTLTACHGSGDHEGKREVTLDIRGRE
ncbi:MAG TPA: hypothetical protein VER17_03800 [Tepidisphaeraceae bacterium]|nr:hypothetical protein [Tepidisphaeraceae bacterium]